MKKHLRFLILYLGLSDGQHFIGIKALTLLIHDQDIAIPASLIWNQQRKWRETELKMAKCEEELHRLELEAMETFADLCRLYLSDSLTNLEVLETLLKLTEEYPHLQDKGSMDEVFSKMFEILNLQPFLQVRRRKNLLRRSKSDFNELHITFSSRSTQSTRTRSLNNTRPFSILQSSAITGIWRVWFKSFFL